MADSKKLVGEAIQDALGSVKLISARRCSVIVRALSSIWKREPYSESVLGTQSIFDALTRVPAGSELPSPEEAHPSQGFGTARAHGKPVGLRARH